MIDLKKYYDAKDKNLSSLTRLTENNFAVSTKKFSPVDGNELPEEVEGGNIDEINARRTVLNEEIEMIDDFLEEFNDLEALN
ncbi:MAG: hypothetical protein HW421_3791 [Ignavibacteria bacterium]|nr:hypothetical protein [Ignavibacteria bacterium]